MKSVSAIKELKELLSVNKNRPLGFVPTMGALHEGHLSLVKAAAGKCPLLVVSIFVNPTQFNDPKDLENYPRTVPEDLKLLSPVLRENDLVFIPSVKEIYPEIDTRVFNFGNLDKVMEGAHRPGHFNGVGQVVSKLFDIVEPDLAFFGQKDFQQLTIIRELVRQSGRKIEITGCPIIREPDGLAMSSRNQLLDPAIRKKAPVIYKAISRAAEMSNSIDIGYLRKYVTDTINNTEGFSVEYFEVADDVELKPINSKSEAIKGRKYYGCVAVKAGRIRLIDNIEFPLG
ncbi:MAG: pantoate--beta-alanine ligase [Bacteroidales bacterium]